MLGKNNMGGSHCNYCTCPSAWFGKEEQRNLQFLSHEDLVSNGNEFAEYKIKLNNLLEIKNKVEGSGILADMNEFKRVKSEIKNLKYGGLKGITGHPYSRILVTLYEPPLLHIKLGTLGDSTNRFQRFIMKRVYSYDLEEYNVISEIMAISERVSNINAQVQEIDKSRNFYYQLSKVTDNEDEKKYILECRNELIKDKKTLEQSENLLALKNKLKKLQHTLKKKEKNRNQLFTSAVYIFDTALKEVGCDRNAYHKQSIDGNKGSKLMENREKFGTILLEKMKVALDYSYKNREKHLENPKLVKIQLATHKELEDEVTYLVNTLNLLNCVLPPIRLVRSVPMSDSEIDTIACNISKLKQHWFVKRPWEKR